MISGSVHRVQAVAPGSQVFGSVAGGHDPARYDGCGYCSEVGGISGQQPCEEVWDILNAGPLQRFTANGRLVHNCLILDHAGNSLRLGLVTDIHYEALDTTGRGEKQERKAKAEKLPKECANCGGLHAGKTCPFCGHERKPTCSVEEADGELSLISGKVKNATREEKQDWWSSIIFIQRSRRKSLGWASHTYKEKFGVWPRGLADTAREPLPEVANFIRAKAIRFAKAQEAKRGAQ